MIGLGLRLWTALALTVAVVVTASGPAAAGSSVFFGFSLGVPVYHRHHHRHYGHYYRHRYYRPPAVVYLPPPVYYYEPAPRVVVQPVCREYRGDATVDGRGTPFYGRACLLDDGRWHIVRVD